MATSGSIDGNLNARDIVTQALRKIRVVPVFDTPSAEDAAQGLAELTLMLKGWQVRGPNLFRQTDGSVTLVADTASYTLSPRPVRVYECRYRDAAGRDLPMHELTRAEYFDMPLKTAQGIPTQYYFDPQVGSGKLYVWPVLAAVTSETIRYTYQRVIEDVDSLTDDIDVPQEWQETVVYALADRLQETYGKNNQTITQRAEMLLLQARNHDRESEVRFVPERAR